MKRSLFALIALAGGSASAQNSIVQQVPFDYDPFAGVTFPEFQMFDTMGGTRELTGVTLQYDQSISFDVRVEQNSPVAIDAGVFFADILFRSLHQLGTVDDGGGDDDDDDNGGPPFLGPGAHGIYVDPALGATDGFNGSGPDTYFTSTDSGDFTFSASYDQATTQSYLDAFVGQGTLTTVLGGLTEIFGGYNSDPGFPDVDPNNPPDGPFGPFEPPYYGVFVNIENIRHQGVITATFEYDLVPAPASATLLALGALGTTRRRRA